MQISVNRQKQRNTQHSRRLMHSFTRDKKEAEAKQFEIQKQAEAKKAQAEADRFAKEQEAEAVKAQGIAEAESIKAKGLADAESIKARGLAEAEAMEKKAEAMAKYGKAAMTEMIIKVLPQMAEAIAKPLESIDKVTIIDGGSGENGGQELSVVMYRQFLLRQLKVSRKLQALILQKS